MIQRFTVMYSCTTFRWSVVCKTCPAAESFYLQCSSRVSWEEFDSARDWNTLWLICSYPWQPQRPLSWLCCWLKSRFLLCSWACIWTINMVLQEIYICVINCNGTLTSPSTSSWPWLSFKRPVSRCFLSSYPTFWLCNVVGFWNGGLIRHKLFHCYYVCCQQKKCYHSQSQQTNDLKT